MIFNDFHGKDHHDLMNCEIDGPILRFIRYGKLVNPMF